MLFSLTYLILYFLVDIPTLKFVLLIPPSSPLSPPSVTSHSFAHSPHYNSTSVCKSSTALRAHTGDATL